jgi:hypothetical protein
MHASRHSIHYEPTEDDDGVPCPSVTEMLDEKVWSTVPSIKPSTHPEWHKTIHRWCFSKGTTADGVFQLIFEVELFNQSIIRNILYASQIKQVITLSKRDEALHRVIIDVFPGDIIWTPGQIAYKFMDPENSIAFHMSLMAFLCNQMK